MSDAPKQNIFQKAMLAGEAFFDQQIEKAKRISAKELENEEDYFYRKSVSKDVSYYIGSQGYQEKPYRLTYEHLKQMSLKDSIISAIIVTRQNQVAGFSKPVKAKAYEKGFIIKLKDEDLILKNIIEDIKDGVMDESHGKSTSEEEREAEVNSEKPMKPGDSLSDYDLLRKAKDILHAKTAKRKRKLTEFILNAGKQKDRPFESERWTFDSVLRAVVRDSMTYDQFGIELVPDQADKLHHFVPVDGSTIRFSSPELGKYRDYHISSNYDLLYPEAQLKALESKDALELDPEKLEKNKYKWVQVVRGKIERAFTSDELKVGMRNPTTDIFNNGYSIPELELLVNLVSSHLNTEFYNQAYFSQGFSAKGILHLKAPLNRRKLETIRQQWQHMIKGSRNSFQTPIFAGMDDVKWIPLTQNHSDIEFQAWLHYLIRMICAIYQIDPQEIGFGIKEAGGTGGGLGGDNTQEKIDQSRDKGLYPLLRFLEDFFNKNIIDKFDADFCLEFVGLKNESMKEALERQVKESKFKKTVNEIREEDGLPPLPGMDDVILGPEFIQYLQMKQQKEMAEQEQAMMQPEPPEGAAPDHVADNLETQSGDLHEDNPEDNPEGAPEGAPEAIASPAVPGGAPVAKSLRIEYYKLGDD